MNTSLYLGIDVSNGYADFTMLIATRKCVGETFLLFDLREGYEALDMYISNVVAKHHPASTIVAVLGIFSFSHLL